MSQFFRNIGPGRKRRRFAYSNALSENRVVFAMESANAQRDSDFPSLSGNAPHPQSSSSTWAMSNASSRRPGQSLMGGQQQSQARQQVQQQQDELFLSSSQLPSSQAGFRYGGQNPVGRASQSQEGGDDFPVLRNAGGEIGQGLPGQGCEYYITLVVVLLLTYLSK